MGFLSKKLALLAGLTTYSNKVADVNNYQLKTEFAFIPVSDFSIRWKFFQAMRRNH